ncbi:MAG: Y-family DNA polymerase [Mailhella sp.]|nr:Y-family DNA polymerase [Mailhella sp.]
MPTLPRTLFLLIDCNNFYASCERLFRPDLANKPVMVLSNNDGCVIARSQEVKKLGIKMGEAVFKLKREIRRHRINVFSSNFPLYGDISSRVMRVVASVTGTDIEQYSIDECFVKLSPNQAPNALAIAREIRSRVLQWVGVPVSVGVATTRTLAKLANHGAKKLPSGVFSLLRPEEELDSIFMRIPVEEVWGIGRQKLAMLNRFAITTVYDLKHADPQWVQKRLTVTGWRTQQELRGISCIDDDQIRPATRKTLVCSRSFGEKISDVTLLKQAVASFSARAAERMRREKLVSSAMLVFMHTSYFHEPFVSDSRQIVFRSPTSDTAEFIRAATASVEVMFQSGVPYGKAGVILFDLFERGKVQGSLLTMADEAHVARRNALMLSLDAANLRYGRGTVKFGAEGLGKGVWALKQDHKSPSYTTCWDELAVAKC